MPAFSCPQCHALSIADHEATYYWCACGQPLTVAQAVPGMAKGVSGEVSSGPAPLPEVEAPAVGADPAPATEPAEVEVEEQDASRAKSGA